MLKLTGSQMQKQANSKLRFCAAPCWHTSPVASCVHGLLSCDCQDLVEYYKQYSLKEGFSSLDTTLQVPYREPSDENRSITKAGSGESASLTPRLSGRGNGIVAIAAHHHILTSSQLALVRVHRVCFALFGFSFECWCGADKKKASETMRSLPLFLISCHIYLFYAF